MHTCEPLKIATEGWLAKVIREFDPTGSNPLTGVSFGRGLPRALAASGLAGFACMAGELTAVRVLAPHFGDSASVWTNVIGVILAYATRQEEVEAAEEDLRTRTG